MHGLRNRRIPPGDPEVSATGRPSLFPGKDLSSPAKAYLTKVGKHRLTVVRAWLSKQTGWPVESLKTSDVIEAALRGEEATLAFLKKTGQLKAIRQ